MEPGSGDVQAPLPGIQDHLFDSSGDLEHTNDGSIIEPSAGRVGPPDPGIDYHSLDYSGELYNKKDGSTVAWLPEAEFARIAALDKGLVEQPGPDILRRVFDPGGKVLVFDPGGVQYFGESYDLGLGLCLRSRSGS